MSHIAAGPWGGQSGYRWDDGGYSTVRQVVISSSAAGIDSVQLEYDKNGSSVWSDNHGGTSGIKTDKIQLDYPNEFLVSISGHYGPVGEGGPVIVRSLIFESNRMKFGPFGHERGVPFSLPVTGGKLVGFHGRSSLYLDSIGVYVKPLMQINPLERQNAFHGQISPVLDGNSLGNEATYAIGRAEQNKFMMDKVPSHGLKDHKVGSAGTQVDAVYTNSKRIRSCGPWGGDGGIVFDDGIYTGVREIHITRSGGLVSMRVCYDHKGRAVWGNKNGGSAGLKLDKIVLDYPFEILTHISGFYGSTILRGPTIVKSLTFHTTKRSYGPFGDQQGFSFSSGTNGNIVGFHGRKGYFVNCIGVHVLEGQPSLHHPPPDPFNMSTLHTSEVVWGMPREAAAHEEGPWGGQGGMPWDDGVYKGVKKILLTRGEAIWSIQIEYDRNGHSMWSAQHGTVNEACTYVIKFEYPYEVLTMISGYYDYIYGDRQKRVLRSLTFQTNRAKYGPYGKEIGTYFSSAKMEGRVVGFHGRSGHFLDAIGVHMQYWSGDGASQHRYHTEKGAIRTMLHKILP